MNGGFMKTCLVVDDDGDMRTLLRELLQRMFICRVVEAAGAWEALKVLDEEEVDVVISDLRMPHGSGVDLVQGLRDRDHAAPVVIFSSAVMPELAFGLRSAGVKVIEKCDIPALMVEVAGLLNDGE